MQSKISDKVYTPVDVAKKIIEHFKPEGKVLDPSKGPGAFYNNFPENCEKYYCEIDEGIDFFEFNEKVDWIISNPPYSVFSNWLKHSFEIADNVVYLFPLYLLSTSFNKTSYVANYGGITELTIFSNNPRKEWGWPIQWPICVAHFKKDYQGSTEIKYINI